MSKRKQSRKSSPSMGVVILIIFLCAVIIGYEPLMQVLSGKKTLEKAVAEAVETAVETVSDKLKEAPRIDSMPVEGSGLEVPAPLKKGSEVLLKRKGFTVSYNRDRLQPNWVAWELNREKLIERESRSDKFLPDPDLPEREAVTTQDYKGSGYDRGHMCPAADNRWHWRAMQESFYMSNICPQNHKLNTGDWKELEEACRRWAEQYGTLYIACGPIFRSTNPKTIGGDSGRRIPVPDAFFKVLLCPDPLQAIGFVYANRPANQPMSTYATSIDQVEHLTGLDFFPALEDEVEREVEAKIHADRLFAE